jgi:hypothetical protein
VCLPVQSSSRDDVPKSASTEESVTGTTSKDDAENSKTSSSNVEDARSFLLRKVNLKKVIVPFLGPVVVLGLHHCVVKHMIFF